MTGIVNLFQSLLAWLKAQEWSKTISAIAQHLTKIKQKQRTNTMPTVVRQVNFKQAAKRHFDDAEALQNQGRSANAGQLYGFTAECGLKALMVAHGLGTEPNGDIRNVAPDRQYRKHLPHISQLVATLMLFPDGRNATRYLALLPDLARFDDWSIDHRYWMESELPSGSYANWRAAARQVSIMLDVATADGVMT
jgi:hypothetical protein